MSSIRRTGSGSAGYSQSRPQDRAAAFRRAYQIGEVVQGRLLRWINDSLAWVNVGGHELVAELHVPPRQDEVLYFQILQLIPDIVLKQLADGTPPQVLTQDVILRRYYACRDALDSLLHVRCWPKMNARRGSDSAHDSITGGLDCPENVAYSAFVECVAADAEVLSAFIALHAAKQHVDLLMAKAGAGTFV